MRRRISFLSHVGSKALLKTTVNLGVFDFIASVNRGLHLQDIVAQDIVVDAFKVDLVRTPLARLCCELVDVFLLNVVATNQTSAGLVGLGDALLNLAGRLGSEDFARHAFKHSLELGGIDSRRLPHRHLERFGTNVRRLRNVV